MVVFFFVLSGFFMVMPLKRDGEELYANVKGWISFYMMRAFRILPLYWGVLAFYFWYSGRGLFSKSFWDNFLFLNCEGHLWFLQQELLCYLFIPGILLFVYLLKKKFHITNRTLFVLLLVSGLTTEYYLRYCSSFRLVSGDARYFRLGNMMIGMAFGYLYKSRTIEQISDERFVFIKDGMGFALITLSYFSSAYFLSLIWPEYSQYYIGWAHPGIMALISGFLVFLIASNPRGQLYRILSNKFLQKGGQASYGIYIIHWYILPMAKVESSLKYFCVVALITICIALVYYEKIEAPMMQFLRKYVIKGVR